MQTIEQKQPDTEHALAIHSLSLAAISASVEKMQQTPDFATTQQENGIPQLYTIPDEPHPYLHVK